MTQSPSTTGGESVHRFAFVQGRQGKRHTETLRPRRRIVAGAPAPSQPPQLLGVIPLALALPALLLVSLYSLYLSPNASRRRENVCGDGTTRCSSYSAFGWWSIIYVFLLYFPQSNRSSAAHTS